MKNLFYLTVLFILFTGCVDSNKDYTAVLQIRRMELSRSPEDSTYVFFVEGYIWNYSTDSIWVIPFDNKWEGNHDYLPSYIVGSINGKEIDFNKIEAVGKLDSGEAFPVYLYKRIKEKEIPSNYLIDHVRELKFSYRPVKDSTIFLKDRLECYNKMKDWMEKDPDPNMKKLIPDYNSYINDYRPYKDSAEMHFVNKMNFFYATKNIRIKVIEDGRDASSLFL